MTGSACGEKHTHILYKRFFYEIAEHRVKKDRHFAMATLIESSCNILYFEQKCILPASVPQGDPVVVSVSTPKQLVINKTTFMFVYLSTGIPIYIYISV